MRSLLSAVDGKHRVAQLLRAPLGAYEQELMEKQLEGSRVCEDDPRVLGLAKATLCCSKYS